jgi:phosphoenolpyruvate synthase/pyruvate phosphate dikinase
MPAQPAAPRQSPAQGPEQVDALVRGLGASPGTYTGRARVIVGGDQFEEVQAGEVLVCPQTSSTWTILLGRIGALVTDDGGILSHPAIAAREFGLPAVVIPTKRRSSICARGRSKSSSMGNGAITRCAYAGGRLELITWNEGSHLTRTLS